jgi:glycosyltransferase involved in cell wall biosynthesis
MLEKCLQALFAQSYDLACCEIIVVDDGSTDGTDLFMREAVKRPAPALRYFRQDKKGPAAARNIGIKNANGEIVLFLGDDIIADKDLLAEHCAWHVKHPDNNIGVLGHITWSPDITITPFMKWLESGGPQFAFYKIEDAQNVGSERFFYSSNISFKKSFLVLAAGFFDEEFPYAAYEDIEFGYRLIKAGAKLQYDSRALAWHCHYTSLADACRRMVIVGFSGRMYDEKTGKDMKAGVSVPYWRYLLSAAKYTLYYPIAKYYEPRAIKAEFFGYVMDYNCRKGAMMYDAKDKALR